MKYLIFITTALLLFSCSGHVKFKDNPKESPLSELKGKVRWIKIGNAILTFYDERGNVIYKRTKGQIAYNSSDSVILFEDLYKYDKNGNLIEQQGRNTFHYKRIYKYDKNDNIIERYEYDENGKLDDTKVFFTYTANTKSAFIHKDNIEFLHGFWQYDNNGNLVVHMFYFDDGLYAGKETFKYVNDKIVEKITHFFDGDSTKENYKKYKKEINKYDSRGNKTESATYGLNDSLRDKTLYAYDNNNNIIASDGFYYHITYAPEYRNHKKYKYNDKHMLVEAASEEVNGIDSSETTETYSDFDAHGNYLKQTTIDVNYENNKQKNSDTTVVNREIEYYQL